jgi:menaquinone-dependent protoporphyrinogen oxidase
MSNSVLVAYATRAGSTRGVAEAVAAVLSENGFMVDLLKAREVRSLDEYAAVLLGAPLYMFHWHADALGFLSRLRPALVQRPVAVFALGPFHDDEKEKQGAREMLAKELDKYSWFKPVDVQIFAGAFNPSELGFPYNLLMAFPGNPMKKMPPSDERNWPEIKGWAAKVTSRWKEKVV